MRARLSLIFAAVLIAPAAVAQDAPPAPAAPASAQAKPQLYLPRNWDELPPGFKSIAERMVGRVSPQAVLHVDEAVSPDADFRLVDHGDVLMTQTVRPAARAVITRPPRNANKYGPQGATLWPGIGPDGDYWCWRAQATWPRYSNIYCYIDKDGDGDFDQLMENDTWPFALSTSKFQFRSLGHDERIRDVVGYERREGLGEIEEVVALRYDGPQSASLDGDNLVKGEVMFELLTGPDMKTLSVLMNVRVPLDASGRGTFKAPNGLSIEVDRVSVDGTARVRLMSGLNPGRLLIRPTMTREDAFSLIQEFLKNLGVPERPEEQEPAAASPEPA